MNSMLDYFDTIIGTTYAQNPVAWVICSMLIIWITYQLFSLVYFILGLNKK